MHLHKTHNKLHDWRDVRGILAKTIPIGGTENYLNFVTAEGAEIRVLFVTMQLSRTGSTLRLRRNIIRDSNNHKYNK